MLVTIVMEAELGEGDKEEDDKTALVTIVTDVELGEGDKEEDDKAALATVVMDVELGGDKEEDDKAAVVVGDKEVVDNTSEVDDKLVVNILDVTGPADIEVDEDDIEVDKDDIEVEDDIEVDKDDIEVDEDDIIKLDDGVVIMLVNIWAGVDVSTALELDIIGGPILKSKNMVVSEKGSLAN